MSEIQAVSQLVLVIDGDWKGGKIRLTCTSQQGPVSASSTRCVLAHAGNSSSDLIVLRLCRGYERRRKGNLETHEAIPNTARPTLSNSRRSYFAPIVRLTWGAAHRTRASRHDAVKAFIHNENSREDKRVH